MIFTGDQAITHRWTVVTLVLLLAMPVARSASIRSAVVFNTICAKCHEGECSGRLSFHQSRERSKGHIVRHYPPADRNPEMQKGLFEILDYMKRNCAFYPVPLPDGPGLAWESEVLESYSLPLESQLFLPLGELAPGRYRLTLDLEKEARGRLNLVAGNFDLVAEECLDSSHRRIEFPFILEEPGAYYFRFYPRQPVRVLRMKLEPLAGY